ncbi:MAG: alanyl aminopeptidase [Cognaticolwellia sp.]|jgi:alanyl aminopeptidase
MKIKRINKFFKTLICFAVLTVVFYIAYNQYQRWQSDTDIVERKVSPQGQLPTWLTPTHYDLTLKVTPDAGQFSGKVAIDVTLTKETKTLWLHGEDISALSATFITQDNTHINLTYHEMGHSGVVELRSTKKIMPQKGTIVIEFKADLDDSLSGLYLVKDGGLAYAFTQFEPNFARMAFPSFDEPRFKTPFDISLVINNGHKGFSNTPQLEHLQLANGFKKLIFKTSKPLPTYLVAVVVGDFDVVTHKNIPTSDVRAVEIPLRGITTKGKGKDLAYALENTASILATIENYFGTPYPYEKLDLVAVPDFAGLAMENAGLITYREQFLLLGDKPSLKQKQYYAGVHAHELVHQWFGNLVTMPWWNDIWLNESFTTWMGTKLMDKWDPNLGFERYMVRESHNVMTKDIYLNTRNIREPIKNSADIGSAFDPITYEKGGAVIQMLENYIGKDDFRKGVQYHMKKYAFGHADGTQFIESIEMHSNKTGIRAAFNSFLNQKGVPLISLDYQCSDHGNTVSIAQSRYLPLGAQSQAQQSWTLPVCLNLLADDKGQEQCFLVEQAQQTFELESNFCPSAIMPNAQGKGYYRWTLPQKHQKQLMQYFNKLIASEKYTVASNFAAEFRAGRINASNYLTSIQPIIADTDWDLISQPVGDITFISNYIANNDEKRNISSNISNLYQPKLDGLGLHATTVFDQTNPEEAKTLRKTLINLVALTLEQPKLLNELAVMGEQLIGYQTDHQLNLNLIEAELIAPALASAVKVHGIAFAQALLAQLDHTEDGTSRQRILIAVARSTDPEISALVIDMLTSLSLRVNERLTLLITHMESKDNQLAIYEWLKSNFSVISMVVPEKYLNRVTMVSAGFCSKEMKQDVENFFKPKINEIPGLERSLSTTLEKIEMCIALKDSQREVNI